MASTQVIATPFDRVITLPSSKSYTNRYLILGSIFPGAIIIQNFSRAYDVLQMIDSLQQIGLSITRGDDSLIIHNSFPQCESLTPEDEPILLETGEGGTTNRFLVALLSRGKKRYRLRAEGNMVNRPMTPLYELLRNFKVDIKSPASDSASNLASFPVEIKGPAVFHHTQIPIDCSSSSQFISALELAYCDSPVKFIPENLDASESYYRLTQNIIKSFYFEKANRNFHFSVPIDFSSLTYPAALAALGGKALISNCSFIDMLQPDSYFLGLLTRMGASNFLTPHGLQIKGATELKGIDVDCSGCPDLVPALAFICAYATTPSTLKGLELLKFKESDRQMELCRLLTLFEIAHRFDEETSTLFIEGNGSKVGPKEYDSPNDHRMCMTAYLFMRANNGGTIHNSDVVKKSFPDFFKIME